MPARAALAPPGDTLRLPSISQTQPALQLPVAMKPLHPKDFPSLIIPIPNYIDVWPQTSYLLQKDPLYLEPGQQSEILWPALVFLSISSGYRTPIWRSDQWYNTKGFYQHLDFCSSSLSSHCKFHNSTGHERWANLQGHPSSLWILLQQSDWNISIKVPKVPIIIIMSQAQMVLNF